MSLECDDTDITSYSIIKKNYSVSMDQKCFSVKARYLTCCGWAMEQSAPVSVKTDIRDGSRWSVIYAIAGSITTLPFERRSVGQPIPITI